MATPWLHLVGIHPDGLDGLSASARRALNDASVVFGSQRHLELAQVGSRGRTWPIPFDLAPLLALRGHPGVVALVSGDPFCFGAGSSLAKHLAPEEWCNHPRPSTFSWVAGELGWALEQTHCVGLHARPLSTLFAQLHAGERFIALLRDGDAPSTLARWLTEHGWGNSPMWVFSNVGGPFTQRHHGLAKAFEKDTGPADSTRLPAPVVAAFQAEGGTGLSRVPGRSIDAFAHDGQITKSPVRAMTLAMLAPRRGELLWDLGAGSGSVSIEWCLAGGRAACVEQHARRVANIHTNAQRFAADLQVYSGQSLEWLPKLPPSPQAVFVGGGFSAPLFAALQSHMPIDCRLVVNAVTLDTQALLMELHQRHGGQLFQLQWSEAVPLGRLHSWQAARPLTQWVWQAC